MKTLVVFLVLLFPLVALAEEPAPLQPVQENGIQIIDGKKFFPLNSARRQLSADLSPSALAVINHPRADPRVTPAYRARMNPKVSSNSQGTADEDILSVFSPEDRSLKSIPLNSSSPYRK